MQAPSQVPKHLRFCRKDYRLECVCSKKSYNLKPTWFRGAINSLVVLCREEFFVCEGMELPFVCHFPSTLILGL